MCVWELVSLYAYVARVSLGNLLWNHFPTMVYPSIQTAHTCHSSTISTTHTITCNPQIPLCQNTKIISQYWNFSWQHLFIKCTSCNIGVLVCHAYIHVCVCMCLRCIGMPVLYLWVNVMNMYQVILWVNIMVRAYNGACCNDESTNGACERLCCFWVCSTRFVALVVWNENCWLFTNFSCCSF